METTVTKKRGLHFTGEAEDWITYTICLLCLVLFSISAYSKIAEHGIFVEGLKKVKLIGPYAVLIAWSVPVIEIIVSLLLLNPKTSKWGLYGFTGVMSVFTLYIFSMLTWAEKIPCHCNLIIEKLSWTAHLWFNLGFIGLAIFALWLNKAKLKH